MPLQPPAPRSSLHKRSIQCDGYQRDDGLWDIEARLIDTKSYGFPNHDREYIEAGEPLHDISLRLTLDEDYLIHAVDASIDASPFNICPAAVAEMQSLVGLSIKKGWMRDVRRRVGGTKGCTHLVDLLSPIATTAFQTMHKARSDRPQNLEQDTKPFIINTCHALADDGPVVHRQWPRFYTGASKKD